MIYDQQLALEAHHRLLILLKDNIRTEGEGWPSYKVTPNNKKPCIVKGKQYESITEAAREMGMATDTLWRWVKERRNGCRYA